MKRYVNVLAEFSEEGKLMPKMMKLKNGEKYEISRIISVMPAASMKNGGCGMRYTCYIGTKMLYLFREEDRWFFEVPS